MTLAVTAVPSQATNDLPALDIVGIALRTNNRVGFETIPAHWQRFYQEQVLNQIAHKASDDVYAVYGLFENLEVVQTQGIQDLTYTLVLGAAVTRVDALAPGLQHLRVPAQHYQVFSAPTGQPQQVGALWQHIWAQPLPRAFVADFERYRPSGEIDVLVGLQPGP